MATEFWVKPRSRNPDCTCCTDSQVVGKERSLDSGERSIENTPLCRVLSAGPVFWKNNGRKNGGRQGTDEVILNSGDSC